MLTTTLNRIRANMPCSKGWEILLKGLGKTQADDEPLPFSKIVEINGIIDALWCCQYEPQYHKTWRLFSVWNARQVQHLNPDPRVKNAIDVAEKYANGLVGDKELMAAERASSAACDAACDAAAARAAAVAGLAAASVASAGRAAASAAYLNDYDDAASQAQTVKFLEMVGGE